MAKTTRDAPPPDKRAEVLADEAKYSAREIALAKMAIDEEREAERDKEFETYKIWVALSAEQKSQLVADKRFNGDASLPLWRAGMVHKPAEKHKQPFRLGYPNLLVRAATEADLRERYCSLCGITNIPNPEISVVFERLAGPGEPCPAELPPPSWTISQEADLQGQVDALRAELARMQGRPLPMYRRDD